MTEAFIALKEFAVILQSGGPWAILFFFWWWSVKESKRWEDRFMAVKRMYESNVRLVEKFEAVASDQKDVIVMNVQALQKLSDQIAQNQYCPHVRIEKKTTIHGVKDE